MSLATALEEFDKKAMQRRALSCAGISSARETLAEGSTLRIARLAYKLIDIYYIYILIDMYIYIY